MVDRIGGEMKDENKGATLMSCCSQNVFIFITVIVIFFPVYMGVVWGIGGMRDIGRGFYERGDWGLWGE